MISATASHGAGGLGDGALDRPAQGRVQGLRRQDAEDAAGRLHEKLVSVYGSERVFMDIDNVPLGVNFVTHIKERLQDCAAVLVIVGRSWTTITDPEGSRRLDNPADHVRVDRLEEQLAAQPPGEPPRWLVLTVGQEA